MMKISKHFDRKEFACCCGCGFDTVDVKLVEVLEALCDYCQEALGAQKVMVYILSGCRCVPHNEAVQKEYVEKYVPYSSDSMHLRGQAADFYVAIISETGIKTRVPTAFVVRYLNTVYSRRYGIGRYKNRVHFDVKSGNARRW